jgi:hypothetical protein
VVGANDLIIEGAEGLEKYEPVIESVTVRAGETAVRNPRILGRP